MSNQTISRFGVAMCLIAFVSGCSLIGPEKSGRGGEGGEADKSNECKWNRSSCMHEGAYESGERSYAEQEAKRLNQAALKRMRRSPGR